MCDFFWQRMDSTDQQGGDLADVVRRVSASGPTSSSSDLTSVTTTNSTDSASWQFPTNPAGSPFFAAGDDFGLRYPLLHELTGTAAFFDSSWSGPEKSGSDNNNSSSSASTTTVSDHQLLAHHQRMLTGDEMNRPCNNLFSRVLQLSPAKPSPLSPRAIKPLPMIPALGDVVKLEHGVQISSPRAPGIKRRKSQAKKVVCIPAPAAASSRPSGEVVPSDLWAWRKYGQKPIKGSPYPRGYYRCSSSKGCSARKQVERSRTDPNMLVITYTSEHNHPWPTQRNALAGSTRSQASKNTALSTSASKSSHRQPTTTASSSSLPTVKEEVVVAGMENNATSEAQMAHDHDAFDQVFYNEPVMAEPITQSDDFFSNLAELEPDPMGLIFSRSGFIGDHKSDEEEEESCSKGLDPFINMFDWGGSSSPFGDQSTKKEESIEY